MERGRVVGLWSVGGGVLGVALAVAVQYASVSLGQPAGLVPVVVGSVVGGLAGSRRDEASPRLALGITAGAAVACIILWYVVSVVAFFFCSACSL